LFSDTWLFNFDAKRWVLLRGPLTIDNASASSTSIGLQSIGSLSHDSTFQVGKNLDQIIHMKSRRVAFNAHQILNHKWLQSLFDNVNAFKDIMGKRFLVRIVLYVRISKG
jgi:hypothetical protein